MLLIILYIHLDILKYINCYVVPYSYFPYVRLYITGVCSYRLSNIYTYTYIYIYTYTHIYMKKVHLKTHVSFPEQFTICMFKNVAV